jgi:metal-sulfur cluster biosynthetic enzyme
VPVTQHTDTESNTLTLIGKLVEWGITPEMTLTTAKVQFSNLTAQQLRRILQQIPSAHRANLEVTFNQPPAE